MIPVVIVENVNISEHSCYKKKNDYKRKRNSDDANTDEPSGNRNNVTADNGNLIVFLVEGEALCESTSVSFVGDSGCTRWIVNDKSSLFNVYRGTAIN